MHRRLRGKIWLLRLRISELFGMRGRTGERGQDLIEYALIVGFIAVACAAMIPYTATTTMRNIYERISSLLINSTTQT